MIKRLDIVNRPVCFDFILIFIRTIIDFTKRVLNRPSTYAFSALKQVIFWSSSEASEGQGANYKKNLKIILRCDNNLRLS